MLIAWSFIRGIVPFIWSLFFGKQTYRDGWLKDRRKFLLFWFSMGLTLLILTQTMEGMRNWASALEFRSRTVKEKPDQPVATQPVHPTEPVIGAIRAPQAKGPDRYTILLKDLEAIKRDEEQI